MKIQRLKKLEKDIKKTFPLLLSFLLNPVVAPKSEIDNISRPPQNF